MPKDAAAGRSISSCMRPAPTSPPLSNSSKRGSVPSRPRPAGPHLPPPVARCWPTVRTFLHTARGLDLRLLAHCRRQGLLYADSRRNAVFVCRDAHGTVTGAELVSTQPAPGPRSFKALAPGSRKARGGFWLPL